MAHHYRYSFSLTNAPLSDRLEVAGFMLIPIEEGQLLLKQSSQLEEKPITTIAASTEFSSELPHEDFTVMSGYQRGRHLGLLMSFHSRANVRRVKQWLEKDRGGAWEKVNQEFDRSSLGRVKPRPMFQTLEDLSGFLSSGLDALEREDEDPKSGISTALNLFCTTYEFDYGEPLYLKTWMALEILAGRFNGSSSIIPQGEFKRVRRELEAVLTQGARVFGLNNDQLKQITDKLPELNRLSIRPQIKSLLDQTFKSVPDLSPSHQELQPFTKIRNDITHTGAFRPNDDGDYNRELFVQRKKLAALLETVLMAMLGGDPTVIEPDWRRAPR